MNKLKKVSYVCLPTSLPVCINCLLFLTRYQIRRFGSVFFNILEETFDAVYHFIMIIIVKQSNKTKKKKRRTKPIRSLPKIPISDYVARFCLWLKQYSVMIPFFGVMS